MQNTDEKLNADNDNWHVEVIFFIGEYDDDKTETNDEQNKYDD